jgi:hypothetical protein
MAKLTPKTQTEVLEQIRREQTDNPKPPPDSPSTLPHRQIRLEPLVFQPRTFKGFAGASEAHIEGLMYAIRHAPDHLINPIDIWWSGKRWLVIYGHHRLYAYGRGHPRPGWEPVVHCG